MVDLKFFILCVDGKFDEINATISMRAYKVMLVEAIVLGFHGLTHNIFIAGGTNNIV